MTLTYGEKAEAKLVGTILRVLRSGRARYALSAGATTAACCNAMAVMASDAGISDSQFGSWLRTIAVSVERTSTACSTSLLCARVPAALRAGLRAAMLSCNLSQCAASHHHRKGQLAGRAIEVKMTLVLHEKLVKTGWRSCDDAARIKA
jgi:hypothetical protein